MARFTLLDLGDALGGAATAMQGFNQQSALSDLALQLQSLRNSDSLAHHDSLRGSWDVGSLDRDDP
jgi:hypothetical protein